MALKEQVISVPLGGSPEEGGGLREGTDSKLLQPPYLLGLTNGELGKDGSVRRRRPANELPDAGISDRAKQNLNSVFNHNGTALVVNTATGPHVYTSGTGWTDTGEFGQPVLQVAETQTVACSDSFVDSAVSGSHIAYVQMKEGAVYMTVYEYSTGALVCPTQPVSSGGTWYNPKIIADPTNGRFNVLYMSAGVSADLVMSKVDAANFPAISISTSITVDTNVDQYDVSLGATNVVYVATGRGTHDARVASYTVPVSGAYSLNASQIFASIGGSDGLGVWFNATSASVYLAAFDRTVDLGHVLTGYCPSSLGSQSLGASVEFAAVPYNTGPSSGWIYYTGFVATFSYAGNSNSDMLLTFSTICYKLGVSGMPQYARAQYGCTQMVLMSGTLANIGDVKPTWNYYATTKSWNPSGTSTSKPMVGMMRLATNAMIGTAPSTGAFAYWSQQYSQSLEGTVLVCSYGDLGQTDASGDTRAVVVCGRCSDDVAAAPEAWRFDPDFSSTAVPVPWYFSRLAWVSVVPFVEGVPYAWARAVYDQYTRQIIPQAGAPSDAYQHYGVLGVYGHVLRTEILWESPPMGSCSSNGISNTSGGYLGCFDGSGTFENSWHAYPEVYRLEDPDPNSTYNDFSVRAFPATNGTGLPALNAATSVVFVWTWVDASGLLHRSAPSAPWPAQAFQLTDDDDVVGAYTLTVDVSDMPPSAITTVAERRYIEVYVSGGVDLPDPSPPPVTGDSTPYLAARIQYDPSPGGATERDPLKPWQLSFDVSVAFLNADGSSPYASSPALYTTGGVLEAQPPPATNSILSTSDRVWLLSRDVLWPSKVLEPGIAPEWNGNLVIPMLTGSGPCIAIAALDEKVVVFKESSIFVITGDGPNNTGGGNAFSVPQSVSTDVGCISRASVVRGPFGLAFQGKSGIYVLDRGLNLKWIGKAVEDTVASVPVVCGVLVPEQSHVRWIVDATGKSVVWNYDMNQWGLYEGYTEKHGVPYDTGWVGLLAGVELADESMAYFAQERPTAPDEGANYVQAPMPLSFTTAWIKAAGIQGFVRVRRALLLCTAGTIPSFFNAHNGLRVEAQYNYKPTTLTTYEWTVDEPNVTWPQYEMHLQYQKFESIRFVVSEVPIDGALTCPGTIFSGMTLRVAVKGTPFKYFRQGDVR